MKPTALEYECQRSANSGMLCCVSTSPPDIGKLERWASLWPCWNMHSIPRTIVYLCSAAISGLSQKAAWNNTYQKEWAYGRQQQPQGHLWFFSPSSARACLQNISNKIKAIWRRRQGCAAKNAFRLNNLSIPNAAWVILESTLGNL